MLGDTLNEHGHRKSMSSFWLFALLFRIYLHLEPVLFYTMSLRLRGSCKSHYDFSHDRFLNISGMAGLQMAFLIAFKQLVPEHTVTFFRSPLKMRVKVHYFHVLTTAFSRDIFIRSSMVSAIHWGLCIVITSPHRLPRIMDLPPFL
jgi:hypothetical protein